MNLSDELKSIVGEVLGMEPAAIPDNANTQTLSGWDSQKHLLLVLTLEEKYGISFTSDEIVDIQSLPSLIQTVTEHVGGA